MNLYAESSAVLAWLLGEAAGQDIRVLLGEADTVVATDLPLVECDRTVCRMSALGIIDEQATADCRRQFTAEIAHWTILPFAPQIIARARQPFPNEPIRAFDALHVASALHAQTAFPDLAMLSLDERVRRVARSLGLPLLPS